MARTTNRIVYVLCSWLWIGEVGSQFTILKDREFETSRKIFDGKAIELREGGIGKRKNKADSFN